MAHFAKIENNIVTQVLVVANEHEQYGQKYLNSLGLEGTWIQTSYNNNFRKKFAAIGDTYNSELDRFEPKQRYASWVWNEELYAWLPPVSYPNDEKFYTWNEETQSWIEIWPPAEETN